MGSGALTSGRAKALLAALFAFAAAVRIRGDVTPTIQKGIRDAGGFAGLLTSSVW